MNQTAASILGVRPLRAMLAIAVAAVGVSLGTTASGQDNPEDRPYPHGDWAEDCAMCHQEPFIPVQPTKDFKHAASFPLKGSHATAACRQCHATLDFEQKPAASCVSCHQDIHRGEMGLDCSRCHESTDFHNRPAMARLHRTFRFPLQGAHATASCESCHLPRPQGQLQYSGVGTSCSDCHTSAAFADAPKPPTWHADAGFESDCLACHTDQRPDFRPASNFTHEVSGSFDLTSAHATQTCNDCHQTGGYAITFTGDCTLCHQADYQRGPGHVASRFPRDCTLCHSRATFSGSTFNHTTSTSFPLTGRHVGLDCAQCHSDGVFEGRSTACASCHQDDANAATNPNHTLAGFSTQCQTCHTTAGFRPVTSGFTHSSTATFNVTQAGHVGATCVQCHGTQPYASASHVCSTCHQGDFNAAANPSHTQAAFSNDCTQCHTIQYANFRPAPKFTHEVSGSFDLTSAHATQSCNDCHQTRGYAISFTGDCTLCHQADYQRGPSHVASSFPRDCTLCHSRATFDGATFNHSTATSFPLTGRHVGLDCAQCHSDGVFAGRSTACASCHQDDANAATNPNHTLAGFGTQCQTCHSTSGFRPVTSGFTHPSTATFNVTQAGHVGATCVQCHGTQPYASASPVCSTCHQGDFNAAANPSHTQAAFSNDCTQCHTIQYANFRPAPKFIHEVSGSFDLTSAHATQTCNDCHQTRGYAISFTGDCTQCHLADYQRGPGHVASNFPRDCTVCHSKSTFTGATFNHATSGFTEYSWARHSAASCTACHTGGVYAGTPTNCYDCHYHRAQFDAQTDPSHIGANFGHTKTECTTCHTSQATFAGGRYAAHDTRDMQIYTGKHRGRWDACSDCHTTNSNYMTVSCAACHSKSSMDSEHQGRAGYSYSPPLCVSCHNLK